MSTRPAIRLLYLVLFTGVLCASAPPAVSAAGGTRSACAGLPVPVSRGWNLLAVPVHTPGVCTDSLFPTAVSGAYIFHETTGYVQCDTLHEGMGFWLKFDSAQTVILQGEVVTSETLQLSSGWNIIGGHSLLLPVSMLRTDPPGIITSQIFGFTPGVGYLQADSLTPGCGYWVKADAPGLLILPAPPGLPCPGIPTVEYGGKTYTTVQIGSQCWLRENLDAGVIVHSSQDQSDNSTIEKYCLGNTQSGCDSLGAYYQWGEAMQYDSLSGTRGICPPGWHLPTLAQLAILRSAAGENGDVLKAAGQGTGTNASGFTALLAGNRSTNGQFPNVGQYAYFWASTARAEGLSYLLYLPASDTVVGLSWGVAADGFAVRCLLDHESNAAPETPHAPSPPDGSAHQLRNPVLRWSGDDPEGDPISFTVYFGAVSPPDTAVAVRQVDTFFVRSDLAPFATYFWRVVAFDSFGDSTRGPVWSFTTDSTGLPCAGIPTVVYGGKTYTTVKIGSQCWLRENLDIGAQLSVWQSPSNNGIIEKHCYADDPANCVAYGALYDWGEAMQYAGAQGICPPGWHLPTIGQFDTLLASVQGDGDALKAVGQGTGRNSSGFSALLAGRRQLVYDWEYEGLGEFAHLWTTHQIGISTASAVSLAGQGPVVERSPSWVRLGLSVRCLLGELPNLQPGPPFDPYPPDQLGNVPVPVTLTWSCLDPEGDSLFYDVLLGTSNPPDSLLAVGQSDTLCAVAGLSGETTYYWSVTARDDHGNVTAGPVWSFTTDALPGVPHDPTPADSAANLYRNQVLRWSCHHEGGEALAFTVYFGTVSPPDTAVAVRQVDTFLVRSDLAPATRFFWRVVAFDSTGDSTHGRVWSFTTASGDSGQPCPGIPTVAYGGKVYRTVKVGNQCWLRENMDIGVRITGMPGDNGIIEKYCYADDSVNCATYGGLYRWREAMQWMETPGTRGVCPPGWHVPSWEDFRLLRDSVGGDGNALKAIGQGGGTGAGTNTSGFSALLAGSVEYGAYGELGEYGRFWISYIEPVYEEAAEFYLWGGSGQIGSYVWNSDAGLSVRCMQDETVGAAPNAPSSPVPSSGATGVALQVLLQWSALDPDGDPLNFDVYLGTTSPPDSLISSAQPTPSVQTQDLQRGVVYYWQVLAHDNHGHSTAGPVWSFTTQTGTGTPCPGVPTVSHGGKTYNTVVIGSRCWLKENLDIGVMITGSTNQTDNGTIEKYCYNNDPASCDTFGGLYQWAEAMQYTTTSGAQGLCPPGWHIPTESQFNSLGYAVNWDANALKAIGQGSGAGAGSDTSGFSALLAGAASGGMFSDRGIEAWHISSTQVNSTNARFMTLEGDDPYIRLRSSLKSLGFSIRCRMDQAD